LLRKQKSTKDKRFVRKEKKLTRTAFEAGPSAWLETVPYNTGKKERLRALAALKSQSTPSAV
jgi:hypothetical protein